MEDLRKTGNDPTRKADHGKRKAGALVFAIVTIIIMLFYILLRQKALVRMQ